MLPLQIDPTLAAGSGSTVIDMAEDTTAAFSEFDPSIAKEFGYAVTTSPTFLGIPIYDPQGLLHLLLHFLFNLLISWIIVQFFYYRKSRRKDYYFTFMMFSSAMFLLLFVMENIKLQIGFALGLFAIFGMIRYRTETVPGREMTYLFIIIAVSIVNGLSLNISYDVLILANFLIIALIWVLESVKSLNRTETKLVTYDKIDLVVPERRQELIADLEKRLGLKINAVEVGAVDFLKDSAFIKVTYEREGKRLNSINNLRRAKDYIGE
jgi:hypothetical protein